MTKPYHFSPATDHVTQSPDDPLRPVRLGLPEDVRRSSVDALNAILVDLIMIRDMYKKHHWQMSGITFNQLHRLLDSHYEQTVELVDAVAERIAVLGGVAIAMPREVAAMTRIEPPPAGRETPAKQLTRLITAIETLLPHTHELAQTSDAAGDDRTNDLVVSDVMAVLEKQSWFLSEHLIDTPVLGDEPNRAP